ncbi:MAG: hypothetical protein HY080_07980 [Gammaproteobacteria bacterium]|nr:hypothetical protein [Gammaproteobacteria bacterium]
MLIIKLLRNKRLIGTGLVITLLGLTACGTQTARMDFVNQSLAEDHVLGTESVEVDDILNQYQHDYSPGDPALALHIDVDRPRIMATGGELYAQLGIVAKPAALQPAAIHVLIYDEALDNAHYQSFEQQVINALAQSSAASSSGLSISVDTAFTRPAWLTTPGVLTDSSDSLEMFLKKISQAKFAARPQHFLLLLGDMARPGAAARQDLIDIAGLLKISTGKLSILSLGEKPDFALLDAIVTQGAGRLAFNNDYFNLPLWLNSELHFIHASHYRELQASIEPAAGVELIEVVNPKNIVIQKNRIQLTLNNLDAGETRVLLVKLKVPAMSSDKRRELLHASLEYFHPAQQRYQKIQQAIAISYGVDHNDCLPYHEGKVARSKLILDTQQTLMNTAYAIQQKRNYHAIALLNQQIIRLKAYPGADPELIRDAAILTKYAGNLYQFQDKWFQSVRVWWDMSWNKDRFQADYR